MPQQTQIYLHLQPFLLFLQTLHKTITSQPHESRLSESYNILPLMLLKSLQLHIKSTTLLHILTIKQHICLHYQSPQSQFLLIKTPLLLFQNPLNNSMVSTNNKHKPAYKNIADTVTEQTIPFQHVSKNIEMIKARVIRYKI